MIGSERALCWERERMRLAGPVMMMVKIGKCGWEEEGGEDEAKSIKQITNDSDTVSWPSAKRSTAKTVNSERNWQLPVSVLCGLSIVFHQLSFVLNLFDKHDKIRNHTHFPALVFLYVCSRSTALALVPPESISIDIELV